MRNAALVKSVPFRARKCWSVLVALAAVVALCSLAATLARPIQAAAKGAPVAPKPADVSGERKGPGPLILETRPEIFVPERPRTELESDRLEALALFSTARMLEHRQKYAEALRQYQRAFRRDPTAATVARSIVLLAVRLGRHAEAVRYALKLADLEEPDPLLLQRLGVYLTETGDYARAVAFYERALAAHKSANPTSAEVLLRMEMGRLYFLLERHDKAAEHFARVYEALNQPEKVPLDGAAKKVLLSDPATTYGLIGEGFLAAGRLGEALAAFEKCDRAKPNKGLLSFNLARIELRKKNPQKALESLQVYFDQRLTAEGMAPYRLLAEILKTLNKESELIERLEKLRAADPENAPLGYYLAERYRLAQRFDKAEPLYRSLMEKTPTLTGFRSLVEIYRKTNRPEALLKTLGEAIAKTASLEPLGPEGQAVLKDTALVQTLVDTARKQSKQNPAAFNYDLRLATALLALDAKQYDAAGEFFELAIAAEPEQAAELLLIWGLGLLMADRYAQAAEVFQRGLDPKIKAKDEAPFYYYLAGALEMQGRTEQALAAARKAAQLGTNAPHLLSRVAWVLYHAKRYDQAATLYREIVEKFGSSYASGEVRRIVREARLVMSNLCVNDNDISQAEKYLEEVLDEFPDDASALNDLGYLWADANKNLARAERMIRKAVETEPNNAAFRDSLGWVLFRRGRYSEAVLELEKAAASDPDPVVLDHLGDAYRACGQLDKARAAWQRSSEAFRKQGKDDKAKEVLQKAKPKGG